MDFDMCASLLIRIKLSIKRWVGLDYLGLFCENMFQSVFHYVFECKYKYLSYEYKQTQCNACKT